MRQPRGADVAGAARGGAPVTSSGTAPASLLLRLAPLIALPAALLLAGAHLPPWAFMWLLAAAVWLGCKWLVLWEAWTHRQQTSRGLALLFLLAWPGMDAERFLDPRIDPGRGTLREWVGPALKLAAGVALLWLVARQVPAEQALWRGWIGMIGLVLLLHFGLFHLLALLWQRMGIMAEPLMRAPLRARSLSDFWKRWNLGFHDLAFAHLFRPLHRRIGGAAATLAVFAASGLVHDLVISVPSRGGYGLPTLYFLIQGAGILLERSSLGRRLLRGRWRGWGFAAVFTLAPLGLLFHRPFVHRVIVPFMEVIGAL